MSDLFHPSIIHHFIAKAFAVMALAQQHIFQGTTKRAEHQRDFIQHNSAEVFEAFRILRIDCAQRAVINDRGNRLPVHYGNTKWPGWPLPNYWAGVSVEDQPTAEERISLLLQTPTAVRWISAEPLLGPVDLAKIGGKSAVAFRMDGVEPRRLDWVVVGGESGPRARPMHPNWVRSIRHQCEAARVPFFFKQWGAFAPIRSPREKGLNVYVNKDGTIDDINCMDSARDPALMHLFTKKAAGHLLDGREWREMPVTL